MAKNPPPGGATAAALAKALSTIPDTKKKKTNPPSSERGVFNQFINAHKALKPYASQIWQWANFYGQGLTPTELAATLYFESGGNPNAKSSAGALGLAQIFDNSANPANDANVPFFRSNRNITAQDKANPAFAIRYAAWRLSGAVAKYGSIDQAYLRDYNPNYKGSLTPISQTLPKTYVAVSSTGVGTQVQQNLARQQTKANNPQVQFSSTEKALAPTYVAWTGKPPTAAEVRAYLKNPISQIQLEMNLSNPKINPLFTKSPVWKQNSSLYTKYYQDIFGPNAKPPTNVLLHGILYSLDETSFKNELQHDQIKGQKAYAKSEEYQSLFAQYKSSYAGIYGTPDANGTASIKMAIKGGWTDTQWQNWLRGQPEYKNSNEYKTRSINLAQSMGLLTGGEAQNILASAVSQSAYGGPAQSQPTPPVPAGTTVHTVPAKPAATPPASATPLAKLQADRAKQAGARTNG